MTAGFPRVNDSIPELGLLDEVGKKWMAKLSSFDEEC
jgi:hypothetical protein